jgi:hypothetical protein
VELDPLLPQPIEVVFAGVLVATVLFAAYAIIKMVTRQWTVGIGLTLIVLTLFVSFGGAVLPSAV